MHLASTREQSNPSQALHRMRAPLSRRRESKPAVGRLESSSRRLSCMCRMWPVSRC